MHLADTFIQSDLHCNSRYTLFFKTFLSVVCFPWESNPWPWCCKQIELQKSI